MNTSVPARANETLIDEMHQSWQADRHSVSPDWAAFFEGFELGIARLKKEEEAADELKAAEEALQVIPPLEAKVKELDAVKGALECITSSGDRAGDRPRVAALLDRLLLLAATIQQLLID
jgi:2-oxoglutarate dehydrogenase complex dehydrogenase (E1) component-like enzyme